MSVDEAPGSLAGVYVHVPFCSRVCPYCDFAVAVAGEEERERWLRALIEEIRLASEWPVAIDTIYLGGGTPSRLDDGQIERVLRAVRDHLPVRGEPHVSLEANPEHVSPQRVRRWLDAGVATLSLGVQSLDDRILKRLGRRHRAEEAVRATERALDAGFRTVSLDLIYGVPDQTLRGWLETLDRVVALAPPHVSCYQLTYHEGTPYGRGLSRGVLAELPESGQADLFLATRERLAAAGYDGYEVSNFARAPRHRSAHNRKYWRHEPYLGLGPAAHSFRAARRWWNVRGVAEYVERVADGRRPVDGEERLSATDLAIEEVALALRTAEGIDLAAFRRRHRVDVVARNGPLVGQLVRDGLARVDAGRLALTDRGLAVADGVARDLDVTPPLPPSAT